MIETYQQLLVTTFHFSSFSALGKCGQIFGFNQEAYPEKEDAFS